MIVPSVYNEADGVVLPIAAVLRYRAEQDASQSTLEGDAWRLAEFWDYLRDEGLDYRKITKEALAKYLDDGAKRRSNVVYMRREDVPLIYKDTIRRKRGTIYQFYRILQDRLNIVSGIIAPKNSRDSKQYRLPAEPVGIGLGVGRAQDDTRKSRSDARNVKERKRRPKGTPSTEEGERLLEALLNRENNNRAATYYLAACLKLQGGARSCGVEDLTGAAVRHAIEEETYLYQRLGEVPESLASLAGNDPHSIERRQSIIAALKELEATGRRYLFAMVIEKKKTRPLPIPIRIIIEILDYMWNERAELIGRWILTHPAYTPPDSIFLSMKTGRALLSSSISKEIGNYLRQLGIRANAHRLRATFAEEIVRELYIKDRAANGGRVDFISIIHLASEMLGHADEKTIRKYLNNVVKKERLLSGTAVLVSDPNDALLLKDIAVALDAQTVSNLRNKLIAFMIDNGVQVSSP